MPYHTVRVARAGRRFQTRAKRSPRLLLVSLTTSPATEILLSAYRSRQLSHSPLFFTSVYHHHTLEILLKVSKCLLSVLHSCQFSYALFSFTTPPVASYAIRKTGSGFAGRISNRMSGPRISRDPIGRGTRPERGLARARASHTYVARIASRRRPPSDQLMSQRIGTARMQMSK